MIAALTGQGRDVVSGVLDLGRTSWRRLRPGRVGQPRRRGFAAFGWRTRSARSTRPPVAPMVSLRVTAELRFGRGVTVGHNTVSAIMQERGIKGIPNRRPPQGSRLHQVTALDLVQRNFRRAAPNQLWLTDITEHPTLRGQGLLLRSPRCLLGGGSWAGQSTLPQTSQLVMNALAMATKTRHPNGELVIHSDRGAQFTSFSLQREGQGGRPCCLYGL